MKIGLVLILTVSIFIMGNSYPRNEKNESSVIMGIMDISCEEVWGKVLDNLKDQGISIEVIDKNKGYLQTAPFITDPFPGDPYLKIKENYRIEILCPKPLNVRIITYPHISGMTKDMKWVEIQEMVNFQKRFLEKIKF